MKQRAQPDLARQRFWFFVLGAAGFLAALFLYLTSEVNEARMGFHETIGWADEFVQIAFIRIRTEYHDILDPLMISVTWLGSGEALTIGLLLGIGFLFWRRQRLDSAYLAIVGIGTSLLIHFLKHYYTRPRPDGLPWVADFTGFSYPSGHATGSAAIFCAAVLVVSHARGRVVIPTLALVSFILYVAIAISRIYLGAHYFSDVLAGGLLGTSWALLVWGCLFPVRYRGVLRWPLKNLRASAKG